MDIDWSNLKAALANSTQHYFLFKSNLSRYVRQYELLVDDSRISPLSWICIYSSDDFFSPRRGIFIDYLFGKNQDVYLTLIQGVKGSNTQELEQVRKIVQQKIDGGSFLKVSESSFLPVNYSKGMVFYKKYTLGSFPDDDQLKADLQELIAIYKKVKELNLFKISLWPN